MGVDKHSLNFLSAELGRVPQNAEVITFGRQEIHVGLDKIGLGVGTRTDGRCYLEDFFHVHRPDCTVTSLDISPYEGAGIVHDLSLPCDENLHGKYDLVIDFGTSEHVYDPISSFRNAANLVKTGGVILHCLPSNGMCGHGFYQFSPDLFHRIYSEENGFAGTTVFVASLLNTSRSFLVNPAVGVKREKWNFMGPSYVLARTCKVNSTFTLNGVQEDYRFTWESEEHSQNTENGDLTRKETRASRTLKRYDFPVSLYTKAQLVKDFAYQCILGKGRRSQRSKYFDGRF